MKRIFSNGNNYLVILLIILLSLNNKVYAGWVPIAACKLPSPDPFCACTQYPCVWNLQPQVPLAQDVQLMKIFGYDNLQI